MLRNITVIMLFWVFLTSFPQKTKKVSAEYTYYAPETMSIGEAKRVALERAQIQAIADEFGMYVSQSTTTTMSNNENGDSKFTFHSFGGSDVKGEWLETIGKPKFEISQSDGMLIVKVNVEGKARELKNEHINFIAKPLRNLPDIRNESVEFHDQDDLYLYFKSPSKGYLAVYLLDHTDDIAYCLLPYKSSEQSTYPIKSDKDYIFFSETEACDNEKIDEYSLTAFSDKDFNDIYILFSSNPFNKTVLQSNSENDRLPKSLSRDELESWIAKLKKKDINFSARQIPISISK